MSRDYDYLVEQARHRPNSTAAIGLLAIQEAQNEKIREARLARREFFSKLFSRKK